MTEEEKPKSPANHDLWRFTAELVKTAIIIGVLAYLIRFFVLQPFIVEGSSMAPRFHTNDYLLVDKFSYRFHEPQRGDIIVFKYPNDLSLNYIKRIIGLPGETVKIKDGTVYIINTDHPDGVSLDEHVYLGDGIKTTLESGAADGEFPVAAAEYFVLGDNRPASSDSRVWGLLPKSDIIGRALVQAYPLNQLSVVQHAIYQ